MADFPGGGFFSGLLGIFSSIGGFIRIFFGTLARDLLRLIEFIKDGLVTLSKQLLIGLWRLGRALARTLRSVAMLAARGVRGVLTWAYRGIVALQKWLKEFFGPVLRRLKQLKDRIQAFYKQFVKPILDTIEFIRQLNRILQVFHIDVLQSLDSVLQQIEQRIEAPFLWVNQKITWLENWIDRIVTADGLFQRVTLLRSTWMHNGAMIRQGWNGMTRPLSAFRQERMRTLPPELTVTEFRDTWTLAMLEGDGNLGPAVREFVDQLRINARS